MTNPWPLKRVLKRKAEAIAGQECDLLGQAPTLLGGIVKIRCYYFLYTTPEIALENRSLQSFRSRDDVDTRT